PKKKGCLFCHGKIPTARRTCDTALLRIVSSPAAQDPCRRVTGNCSQHRVTWRTAIQDAREMALLPYMSPRAKEVRADEVIFHH
ncbi:hypothetical protein, partial [Streptosporangium vulgare]|uniref:hypothetical protein n=1 Tax=Streptosporangium vulgare TaxID=46190 RepID=UPI0031E32CFE